MINTLGIRRIVPGEHPLLPRTPDSQLGKYIESVQGWRYQGAQ